MKRTITTLLSSAAALAVCASAYSDAPARPSALQATPPQPSFVQTEGLGRGYLGVKLTWTLPPQATKCGMEYSVNGGPYRERYLPAGDLTQISMNMVSGASHKVRVRAGGPSGDFGDWAESLFTLAQDRENSPAIAWSGNWTRVLWEGGRNWGALDQPMRVATATGATATYSFTGPAVAWLADRGPQLGSADVYLDGSKVGSVDLSANEAKYADLVFSRSGLSTGSHALEVKVTSSGKSVNILAFGRISP